MNLGGNGGTGQKMVDVSGRKVALSMLNNF